MNDKKPIDNPYWLPNEIWCMILEKLDSFKDLIRCKMVNKAWFSIIEYSVQIQFLAFLNFSGLFRESRYNLNYKEPIEHGMTFKCDHLPKEIKFNYLNHSKILSRIKCLNIRDLNVLSNLNLFDYEMNGHRFGSLEHLEIKSLIGFNEKDGSLFENQFVIRLPSLQILSLGSINLKKGFYLKLSLPNLSKLDCDTSDLNEIEIVYPQSLTHLSISQLNQKIDLNKFSNVQFLGYNNFYGLENLIKNHVFNSSNLREIHLSVIFLDQDFDDLWKQKEKSTNPNIRIYCAGILVSNYEHLKSLFQSHPEFERKEMITIFNTKNLIDLYSEFVTTTDMNTFVDCNELIDHFKTLPIDFLSKFYNITIISVGPNLDSEENFIRMIKNCSNLKSLFVDKFSLSQAFYSNLATWCKYLIKLVIKDKNQLEDLSFILDHRYLVFLSLSQQLDYHLFIKLLKSNPKIRGWNISINTIPISIKGSIKQSNILRRAAFCYNYCYFYLYFDDDPSYLDFYESPYIAKFPYDSCEENLDDFKVTFSGEDKNFKYVDEIVEFFESTKSKFLNCIKK